MSAKPEKRVLRDLQGLAAPVGMQGCLTVRDFLDSRPAKRDARGCGPLTGGGTGRPLWEAPSCAPNSSSPVPPSGGTTGVTGAIPLKKPIAVSVGVSPAPPVL
jgi:hypothetical protein